MTTPVNENEPISRGNGTTRRTVIKAAAWSTPVVAVAMMAPMASASVDPVQSTLSIEFSSADMYGNGTNLESTILFVYKSFENEEYLTGLRLTLAVPESVYTGGYSMVDTGGEPQWVGGSPVLRNEKWEIPFSYDGVLLQSEAANSLSVLLDTNPSGGAPVGTVWTVSAYGIDDSGHLTEVIVTQGTLA